MTLPLIVFRSLRQHALSSVITALCISLAGGLLMSVWVVKEQSFAIFTGMNAGFDAVLGARGSKLQLILNAIFHLESSPGNLAWSDYQEIKRDPAVDLAMPIAVGDNYLGYRLVGTLPEVLTNADFTPGKKLSFEPGGEIFEKDRQEAVVGSFAARKLGLKLGDAFHPYHGLIFNEKDQHSETYLVSGILEPSNTPADKVIWIPLAGIQNMAGHNPDTVSDISAVLVKLKTGNPTSGFRLDQKYNKLGNRLTFAWPISTVVAELFNKINWFDQLLALIAYLVALMAAASILASIYNSMNERRRDIAILRALGARRGTIFGVLIGEAIAISTAGMAFAFFIHLVIMIIATGLIRSQTGVVLDPLKLHPVMLWAPATLIALGALAGMIPAIKGYRIEVAENLTPGS